MLPVIEFFFSFILFFDYIFCGFIKCCYSLLSSCFHVFLYKKEALNDMISYSLLQNKRDQQSQELVTSYFKVYGFLFKPCDMRFLPHL